MSKLCTFVTSHVNKKLGCFVQYKKMLLFTKRSSLREKGKVQWSKLFFFSVKTGHVFIGTYSKKLGSFVNTKKCSQRKESSLTWEAKTLKKFSFHSGQICASVIMACINKNIGLFEYYDKKSLYIRNGLI